MRVNNLLVASLGIAIVIVIISKVMPVGKKNILPEQTKVSVQISGWVAWWKDQEAYELITDHPGVFKEISPVWYLINSDFKVSLAGSGNKEEIVKKLQSQGISVIPTLGSELSSGQFSQFINDGIKIKNVIDYLVNNLLLTNADGLDVDLENINENDRDKFTSFINRLARGLKEKNLKLSVTIHAQTGNDDWEGTKGQDIAKLAELADEIRIMTYDKHTTSTEPGAIAPISWIKEVAAYNERLAPKEKIVFGLPSYSYIWPKKADPQGLQFDEFNSYLNKTKLPITKTRDSESHELKIQSSDFTAWLSDSYAIKGKIDTLTSLGFGKFIIWHIGGMDEEFFLAN